MSLQQVTIIDQKREVVATAQVTEQDGTFTGQIDLSPMSVPRRRQFEAYEEIVSQQMFSLLDEIEEKIGSMRLQVVFADGHVVPLADLQIYPSTKKVSFKVVKARW
jgi:prepilin-type processing-associated H-X9-DG protein